MPADDRRTRETQQEDAVAKLTKKELKAGLADLPG